MVVFRSYILVVYSFSFGAFITFFVQSGFIFYVQPGSNEFINYRKQKANMNWQESVLIRNEFEKTNKIPCDGGESEKIGTRVVWDHWYPTFDCPYMLNRFGRIGDGGKWICGIEEIEHQEKCVVYSFGIKDDTSFEEFILNKTKTCKLYMFDPTVSPEQVSIVAKHSNRTEFNVIGLGGVEVNTDFVTKSLKTIMKDLGHTYLDILKIDIEGFEIKALMNMIQDFPEALPFGQLQIEIHIPNFQQEDVSFHDWRNLLETAGLRPFHTEPNMNSYNDKLFMEFSFLNIKSGLFKL